MRWQVSPGPGRWPLAMGRGASGVLRGHLLWLRKCLHCHSNANRFGLEWTYPLCSFLDTKAGAGPGSIFCLQPAVCLGRLCSLQDILLSPAQRQMGTEQGFAHFMQQQPNPHSKHNLVQKGDIKHETLEMFQLRKEQGLRDPPQPPHWAAPQHPLLCGLWFENFRLGSSCRSFWTLKSCNFLPFIHAQFPLP